MQLVQSWTLGVISYNEFSPVVCYICYCYGIGMRVYEYCCVLDSVILKCMMMNLMVKLILKNNWISFVDIWMKNE